MAGVVVAGCTTSFPDETAELTLDGRTITVALDACGLDGDTVILVGRTDDGEVLQAVVGVEPSDGAGEYTALAAASGLTFTDDAVEWAAFGDLAWARRGGDEAPPGEVVDAELDGSRVQLDASVAEVEGTDVVGDQGLDVTLEARCDAAPVA